MATKGYLGIDAGTQGLSIVFTDEQLNVLGSGNGNYSMVCGLEEGCYEQDPADWESALQAAMADLRQNLDAQHLEMEVLCIGISGQMHGEVLADADGNSLGSVRLWCDSRNEEEEIELTRCLGTKMPKRITSARWLWTTRNQPDKAGKVAHITTPSGWLSYRLTGTWNLGVGDAAGMFPIDQQTLTFDRELIKKYAEVIGDTAPPLDDLLPTVRCAGEDAGQLNGRGAGLLSLPEGIPVAPAEGDQPAALAGSLICDAGMVSISFGTSVCANSVGDRPFQGVCKAIDHFCAPDGKPINMVWLRNGTTFMNSMVEMFGRVAGGDRQSGFAAVIPEVLKSAADCGGILALPFMDDEPGLDVGRGGTAILAGLNPENSSAGNVVKAALLSTMFNLRIGSEVLDIQGFPRTELVLSGGLAKSPELAQILADVFATPVSLLASAEEGTAWGAALMARFRFLRTTGDTADWSDFLKKHRTDQQQCLQPDATTALEYEKVFQRYRKLLAVQPDLDRFING